MELVDDACGKECEELQFCLEKAEELKGKREMEVDVEEPDVLSCHLMKIVVLQVGDVAIAAAWRQGMEKQKLAHHLPGCL